MVITKLLLRRLLANRSRNLECKTSHIKAPSVYNTMSLADNYGYEIEPHEVFTEDGYILTLHRIKQNRYIATEKTNQSLPPVILQHGLWSSSADWAVPDPRNSLGYLLADEGFDVWLGNSRGNVYSRKHTSFSPEKQPHIYWDFSWHEMGYYDVPATVDYILQETSHEQLYYVGHSQGTTIFFVMASTRRNYNDKIKAMVGLAPVAYLNHMRSSSLKRLARFSDKLYGLCNMTGYYKLLPEPWMLKALENVYRIKPQIPEKIVVGILNNMCPYACDAVKDKVVEIAAAHISSGASLKQLAHYAQLCCKDLYFSQFDYGCERNLTTYGQKNPPEYKLDHITAPVKFYYSDYDWLTHPKDVESLYSNLPNQNGLHKVNQPMFNHLDFLWSTVSRNLIFCNIVYFFKERMNYI